jgi:hypothetical protein
MPPVIGAAAAAAVYTGLTTTLIGTSFLAIVAAGTIAAVIGAVVTRTFTPRRLGAGGFSTESQDRQVMVRSSVEPRRIVYGEVGGLSGPLVFAHVSHETAIVGTVQTGEHHNIPPASPFTVAVAQPSAYSSTIKVTALFLNFNEGSWSEDPIELTPVGGSPGANEYSVSAGIYTFHSSRAGQHVAIIYNANQSAVVNSFFHLVIALAGHQVQEIGDVMLGTDVITSAMLDAGGTVVQDKYAHYVRIKKYLGTADQTADADLVAESSGKWTSAHRGRGVAYIYVRLRRNPDLFPNGIPPIRCTVKGALLLDTRTSTTAYSNNWALAVNDYLRRSDGLGCDASEINTTAMNAAANIADEDVDLDAVPTTQKRYTVDGTISLDERPLDVLKALVSAGAGGAIYSVGTWDVYAGAYTAPTGALTVSDLRGPITGRADLERRELFNGVRGTCTDPDRDWQPSDFPPVTNATYVADDNGEEIFRDIDLPFVTNKVRAQRLAKIYLERARQALTFQWPGKPKLFRYNSWETMNVTVPALGWTPKVARILGWRWAPGGGVDLNLQEEAAGIYDWNFGEATTYDLAPNTNLPNTGAVPPPGNPVVTEQLVETRDGRGVAVEVTITSAPSEDLYVVRYEIEYKLAADLAWISLPLSREPVAVLLDVAAGVYDFRARAVTSLGRRSVYSQTRQEIVGLGEPPAAPSGVSLQIAGGNAIITLEQHEALDVRRGGRILVRHTEATTGQLWEESSSIGNQASWPGDSVVIFLPLKPGSYLLKALDAGGNESTTWTTVVTKQASVLGFTTLATTIQEDNTFPGSHSDTQVVTSTLRLTEPSSVVSPSGTYTFSAGFDFTTVKRARITGQIEAVVFNAFDLIDSRTDDIDSWTDFDGATGIGSSADVWLEARKTDDNPAGSPTWTAWERLDASEVTCRGMQFRLQMRSFDPTINILVDVLRVKSDEVL